MSLTTSTTVTHLTRAEVWSAQIKEILKDELSGQGYVNWRTDFPDGTALNIPSIGDASVRDYTEDTAIVYDSLDTGEFTLDISEYKQSGLYITEKARQDAFYAAQLEAGFVPKISRALAEQVETNIFALADPTDSTGDHTQTTNNANAINGANHRLIGQGSSDVIALADFAKALYALKKANVPDTNLIAIVDPSVEYELNTIGAIDTLGITNQRWDNIVEDGIGRGLRFTKNIYGFDVYVSNYLARTGAAEAGISAPTAGNGVNNILFSAASPDIIPFIGAWRQEPKVDSDYNKDFQREEYVITARYGLDLYRPENFVTIVTDATQV